MPDVSHAAIDEFTAIDVEFDDTGEPWANDTDGSALSAQPGQSQGRPPNSRALTPIVESGLPTLRSPEGP